MQNGGEQNIRPKGCMRSKYLHGRGKIYFWGKGKKTAKHVHSTLKGSAFMFRVHYRGLLICLKYTTGVCLYVQSTLQGSAFMYYRLLFSPAVLQDLYISPKTINPPPLPSDDDFVSAFHNMPNSLLPAYFLPIFPPFPSISSFSFVSSPFSFIFYFI
jgi:hypothetical protein